MTRRISRKRIGSGRGDHGKAMPLTFFCASRTLFSTSGIASYETSEIDPKDARHASGCRFAASFASSGPNVGITNGIGRIGGGMIRLDIPARRTLASHSTSPKCFTACER
jgi:hypothetical protein